MLKSEIEVLVKDLIAKINKLAEDIKKVVVEYQNLNYKERKEVQPLFKELVSAVGKCVKAAGTGWWHKWGHWVFGWLIGGFIGLALVLGVFKILFE